MQLFIRHFAEQRNVKTHQHFRAGFDAENERWLPDIHYGHLLGKYPEIMNKEQMRKACHINKSDVIAFVNDREINPEKYIVPEHWYQYGGAESKAYKIRVQPSTLEDSEKMRRYYESELSMLPDVVVVDDVAEFTGYKISTVHQWIRNKRLHVLPYSRKYMIPKCFLIDWLCSDEYNHIIRKSKMRIDMLREMIE